MKTTQQIADDIIAALPDAAPPDDMKERLTVTQRAIEKESRKFRINMLLLAAMHIEDCMTAYPAVDKDSMKRLAANELLNTAAFLVRSLKRATGIDIEPARFALVAYAMADDVLQMEWDSPEADAADWQSSIKGEVHRQRLIATRERIAAMPDDDSIRVECIARTFRNALSAGGTHAKLALELVSEELEVTEVERA